MDYRARWIDTQYVCGPPDGPEEWYSIDGDNWIDETGNDANSEKFQEANILLVGGNRDGEWVS